jgi:hypothetical protein
VKVWRGFGTEHSMNLVMIGHFRDVTAAEAAYAAVTMAAERVRIEEQAGRLVMGEYADEFSDGTLRMVRDLGLHSLGPDEVEQFLYDVDVQRDGTRLVLRTDEISVMAFVKLLLLRGARLEMFSGHDYPGGEHSDVSAGLEPEGTETGTTNAGPADVVAVTDMDPVADAVESRGQTSEAHDRDADTDPAGPEAGGDPRQ